MSDSCNPVDYNPPDLLSMEFSRQKYWSRYPLPSPGNLLNLGIEPKSPALQADFILSEPPGKPQYIVCTVLCSFASIVRLSVTLWTVAHQTLQSMGFSRQEYWSGLPCPPPGELPDPGIEPMSPALQVDSLPLSHQGIILSNTLTWAKFVKRDGFCLHVL